MNVIPAWKKGYTGKNVVVTILDDGIEHDHPDLQQNYVRPCLPYQPAMLFFQHASCFTVNHGSWNGPEQHPCKIFFSFSIRLSSIACSCLKGDKNE